MSLGIQYGLTYDIAPSKHRAIIVLECIPFDDVKTIIRDLINEVIKDFLFGIQNNGMLSQMSQSLNQKPTRKVIQNTLHKS